MFTTYALRTTDVPGARRFYAEALGLDLPLGGAVPEPLAAWPLHERAIARGAPPHWLGRIAVDDVAATVDRLQAHGAELLGPVVTAQDGVDVALLRDPLGALFGLRRRDDVGSWPMARHQLHTSAVARARAFYAEAFGWTGAGGGVSEAGPGVHVHWLFFFPVPDVDAALAAIAAHGGNALPPVTLPDGTRLAAAEDPQGAAFGVAGA
ncbi:MAG: VOC family protein [Myxococcota bacterium]